MTRVSLRSSVPSSYCFTADLQACTLLTEQWVGKVHANHFISFIHRRSLLHNFSFSKQSTHITASIDAAPHFSWRTIPYYHHLLPSPSFLFILRFCRKKLPSAYQLSICLSVYLCQRSTSVNSGLFRLRLPYYHRLRFYLS